MKNYEKTVLKVSIITLIGNIVLSVFKILIGFFVGQMQLFLMGFIVHLMF